MVEACGEAGAPAPAPRAAGALERQGQQGHDLGELAAVAVEGALAGVLAGDRERCAVAELRSRMPNWRAVEIDGALRTLVERDLIEVADGWVRLHAR